ncbi:MAG: hypothetical protein DSY55_02710 [Clostridia bacterium]|nr:MAG: hypothetical protein DSY55_02710 [Clostridia bacterium]
MTDSFANTSDETPAPETQPEITVGEVNATFPAIQEEPADTPDSDVAATEDDGPPPLIAAPPARDRTGGCLRDVLMMLVSILLGALLALTILLGLNGTLSLNEQEKTTLMETEQHTIQSRQEKLQQQIAAQQQQLATLDARTQAMEQRLQAAETTQQAHQNAVATLQAQTKAMTQTTDALQQQISDAEAAREALADHVEVLDEDVSGIQDSVASFGEEAARFDTFMQGLFTLISDLAPAQAATTPQATATPQPPQPSTPEATTPPATEILPPVQTLPRPHPGRSIIAGVIWTDVNNDGVLTADDKPLPGVWVSLKDANEKVLLSMVTGGDGHFAFLNIAPGKYFVAVTPVDGFTPAAESPQMAITRADSTVEVDFRMVAAQ